MIAPGLKNAANHRSRALGGGLPSASPEVLLRTNLLGIVGRLATEAFHEVGTPLNVISGHADLMGTKLTERDELEQSVRAISSQTKRIADVMRQLLAFASSELTNGMQCSRPHELFEQAALLVAPACRRACIGLDISECESETSSVAIPPFKLLQVLVNLYLNGIDAMPHGGVLQVGVTEGRAPHDGMAIFVADGGVGIDARSRQRIFDPFFTTGSKGAASGLGLTVCRQIIEAHRGAIDMESAVGHGSRVTIVLPKQGGVYEG